MPQYPAWLDSLHTTEDSRYASEYLGSDHQSFLIFDKRCPDLSYAYLLFSTKLRDSVLITIAKVTPDGTPSISVFQSETFQMSMYCARDDIAYYTMEAMIAEILSLDISLDSPVSLAYKFGGIVNSSEVSMPKHDPKLYQ